MVGESSHHHKILAIQLVIENRTDKFFLLLKKNIVPHLLQYFSIFAPNSLK